MELLLFNSLEKKITKLSLWSNQTVNIYLCGPTVYDHIHIGNLRSVIVFDVLHRLLLSQNIKVNYVQNITDIDDKIIAKSQKENKSEKEISDYYTQSYFANLDCYNVLLPNHSPRVTNYIAQIQEFIKNLLEKGIAYQQKGEVFFSLDENKEYGRLSGQSLDKLKKGEREITRTNKKNDRDFILWKKVVEGITWFSPWEKGRPGWHTECVVLINEIFHDQTIDIHGGGNDLLFPHHENERIQYLAYSGRELSKIWLHVAHVNWKKEKMSKSLGNVILVKHFYQKYGSDVLRHLILSSHYNQVISISEELIQQSVNYVKKINNLHKKLKFYLYIQKINIIKIIKKKTNKVQEIISNLLNNLNTIKAFYYLDKTIISLNKIIDKKEVESENLIEEVNNFYFILDILGFKFSFSSYDSSSKLIIDEWQKLQKQRNYDQADKIRKKLQEMSIL